MALNECTDPFELDRGLNEVSYVQERDDRWERDGSSQASSRAGWCWLLSGEKTVAEVCREYDLTAQMVNDWTAQFLAAAPQAFEKGTPSNGEAERIAELEQAAANATKANPVSKFSGAGGNDCKI